jgi:hypothetical protein
VGVEEERKEGRIRRERVNLVAAINRAIMTSGIAFLGIHKCSPKADWTQPYSTLPCTLVQTGS